MGVIRQLKCPSCHKEWQLCLGHGMRHGVLGRAMEAFSEDLQKKIVEEAQGGQLPLFHFNYKAAVCGRCRRVVAVPVLRLIETGQVFVGECPDCGGVVRVPEEGSPIICPSCGSGELDELDTGHWD